MILRPTAMEISSQMDKIGLSAAGLLVCPAWVWLAVRTSQCLRVITGHTIPFSRRKIWLIKILALIVGAGNVGGILIGIGVPWLLALLPAAIIVFLSLKENVSEVVPPKPTQDPAVYESAWREYERLRASYRRAGLGFVTAFLLIIPVVFIAEKLPPYIQTSLFAVCLVAFLVSIAGMSVSQWKWFHWRCPRCGCSFRGEWGWLWLPKKCVYCGLPRREKGTNVSSPSRNIHETRPNS